MAIDAKSSTVHVAFPRELVPDVYWLGDCYAQVSQDEILHSYNSVFLIRGTDACMLVEAGLPLDGEILNRQLNEVLGSDSPPLKYIFATHQETPHAGGLGRLLTRFPEATVIGDVRDYHLVFPEFCDRLCSLAPGESVDLGGLTPRIVVPVIRDLITTQWLVLPERRALFSADGFAWAHYHRPSACGLVASEAPPMNITELGAMFIEFALQWLKYVDTESLVIALERLISEEQIEFIGPTHGLPITDVPAVMPAIYQSLREAADSPA